MANRIPVIAAPVMSMKGAKAIGLRATLPARGVANNVPYALKALSVLHRRCQADKVTSHRTAGGHVLHEYSILRVRPTTTPKTIDDVAQPRTATGQRREHLVRGHFRLYTPERPLFGHTSGAV